MSDAGHALEVRDLHHSFAARKALDDVHFTVARGSIHGFVGPNGAGKTTTLRVIATLLQPNRGSVHVLGLDAKRDKLEVRRKLGFMPDQHGLYRHMTVQEYLEFFAAAYGIAYAQRMKVVGDVLELTDMDARRHDLVQGLSRGMEQRLGLARVLVHDPQILLLDEPASGLDPRARIELMEILRELSTMGKTVFISSHILSELATLCDSVTIIDRGAIRYSGAMDELLEDTGGEEIAFELQVERPDDSLAPAFEEVAGVARVEFDAELSRYTIVAAADELNGDEVLRVALERGVGVRAFARSRRHLDRAFLDLTQPGVGP